MAIKRKTKKPSRSTKRRPSAKYHIEHTPEKKDFLTPILGPELVFGLVGPIGTNLTTVSEVLADELRKVRYNTTIIHVTDLLKIWGTNFTLAEEPLEKRYDSYIKAGNKLRESTSRADAFALLSIAGIRSQRRILTGDGNVSLPYQAYILSQFKRPEEIDTLRRVYGRGFIQISAYCSKQSRLDALTRRIAESHKREKRQDYYRSSADELMVRDEEEEENPFGQRVRDTFPLADVVINAESVESIKATCSRFVRAFFNDPFITPTPDEYGAFAAKNASLRSSDLSRQVGAVIMTSSGEIQTMGCNEVPKAGGGTYWEGEEIDFRDFRLGYDPSGRAKSYILHDIFRRLKANGWLSKEISNNDISDIVEKASGKNKNGILNDASVMDLLEFGRIIHAEMSAITDAARLGVPIKNSTLYCTTFPCHICARHIVSSGVGRVVYIEPYPKSLAAELYPDSIEIDQYSQSPREKVRFEPFVGIAPERYSEIFLRGKRKDAQGQALEWDPLNAEPILKRLVPAYLTIEQGVMISLPQRIAALKPPRQTRKGKRSKPAGQGPKRTAQRRKK